ncbi:hypothetical protein KBY75_08450 [Cyanobium sp. T1G-Tous]|uniref:reprolysin-like metallopeptidase n=1 Tax=Cyanobium sp. T1G-Tous TaxID=2823722 RepID=UPI0020CCFB69|nr:hypothetical protein [Cyanobium sp. T1G-Tous]MCP9803597.1 hypothetical protein [Cyanobium sp. T1G-Tous]
MSIAISAITSQKWAEDLRKFSGYDGVVNYWLADSGERQSLGMSGREVKYIRKVFDRLDQITSLDFEEKDSRAKSDIDFYCVDSLNGNAIGVATSNRSWYDIEWVDRLGGELARIEAWVIAHEIGHTLGLDHPNSKPYDRRYDTMDTIMSYNYTGFRGFTDSDTAALQSLWS